MIPRQRHPGRPRIDVTIRGLIREMATDGWGAPRIHDELMKLGFEVSEATVSRYLPRLPADPDQLKRWMAFLRNHLLRLMRSHLDYDHEDRCHLGLDKDTPTGRVVTT